jgi:hypothetical protein
MLSLAVYLALQLPIQPPNNTDPTLGSHETLPPRHYESSGFTLDKLQGLPLTRQVWVPPQPQVWVYPQYIYPAYSYQSGGIGGYRPPGVGGYSGYASPFVFVR